MPRTESSGVGFALAARNIMHIFFLGIELLTNLKACCVPYLGLDIPIHVDKHPIHLVAQEQPINES
jgi:hypothetical protein